MTESLNPEVSVIIPVYNAEDTLKRCLESVALAAENVEIECLTVLDAPTDNSESEARALARRFPFMRILTLKRNMGPAAARREGMLSTRGEYILNLDADDTLCPGSLGRLLAEARRTDADIVVGGYRKRNPDEAWHPQEGMADGKRWAVDVLSGKVMAYLSNKLFRRALYSRSGAYCPQDIRLWEDKVLCVELFSCARKVASIDLPVFEYFRSYSGILAARQSRLDDMAKALDALTGFLDNEYALELDRAKLRLKLDLLWATNGRKQRGYARLYNGIDVAVLDRTEVKPIWKLGLMFVRMNNLSLFNLFRFLGMTKRRIMH